EQKAQWAKNRLDTYRGSFMHFLRSVYANNTLENGFVARPLYGYGTIRYDTTTQDKYKVIVKNRQVKFDSLITPIDTTFTAFRFKQLYVIYDPKKASGFGAYTSDQKKNLVISNSASLLRLATDVAIIDKKGSYTDYRDFYIQGYWAKFRVGDQLPVEYKPPVPDIPHGNIPTNKMLTALQKWTDSIPQEKAYLHMDKPYYASGDTLWFKGYLTSGSRHQLSFLSGSVYVDLINDQNQAVKTLKLPVDSGTVAGNMILGEDIKQGSYRVRAYTQWMRNAGDDYFFDHTFIIGDPKTFKEKSSSKLSLMETDIQFFPESGNLVNGVTSRVGFKVTGTDGLGVPVSGKILDNDNKQVAEFTTLHAGIGSFLLRPLPGKTYTAQIKFADSTTKGVGLPAVLSQGYVLSVYQPNKDSILVRILASPTLQHSSLNLVAHSSGEVIFSSPVEISGLMTSIWVDKRAFPSGIAQFTIFDGNNQPLNERIVFIKGDDHMALSIKTEKPLYKGREHVQLQLNAKEGDGTPVAANFSIAVTDASKVPVDETAESTIFSNLLLTSDIKGYIERPNYYFTADTDEVNKALDNLMLTQGYRRFEWKLLDSVTNAKPIFTREGLAYTISGTVTTLTHHPLANADIMLLSMNARISKTVTTDANGRFRFDSLMFADSAKFAIQAKTKENTDHAIITLDSIPRVTVNPKQSITEVTIIK
ncbi:MAG TPA: carboxypeptidase regulatory-like domain-containing protein, partial [Mucilaginibacter sp.]|nr:carboxypeptidase regulatory-like domain-containing protein [Mucilaginibacter sp.]